MYLHIYPHESSSISNRNASPYDFWDLNGDNVKQSGEPWSYDNFSYDRHNHNYIYANGTEENGYMVLIRKPDSEDLNYDKILNISNHYNEYSFSLDKQSTDSTLIIDGFNNPNGWRLYRLTIDEPDIVVGSPNLSHIPMIRIWLDNFPGTTQVSIAEINLSKEGGKKTREYLHNN